MTDWYPHLTVATLVQRNDRFLVVEEMIEGKRVINQPAGHVERGESLFAAALRETLEETGYQVELTGIVGFYLYHAPHNDTTYHRCCFAAQPLARQARPLDAGIIAARWMALDELRQAQAQLRSPLVLGCIEDFLRRPLLPLDYLRHLGIGDADLPKA